jgi:hypothetical protein
MKRVAVGHLCGLIESFSEDCKESSVILLIHCILKYSTAQ